MSDYNPLNEAFAEEDDTHHLPDGHHFLSEDYSYEHDALNEAFAEEDDEYYLPLGHHLLSEDYKNFLVKWHKELEDKIGNWVTSLKEYARKYPVEHVQFITENNRLSELYAAEVAAVQQYQKDHPEERA